METSAVFFRMKFDVISIKVPTRELNRPTAAEKE